MKRLLLATVAVLGVGLGTAQANVVILDKLSGTGDNVVFDSFNGTNLAVGSFNGQHQGLVDFSCLAGCMGFSGAKSGNDIKITNTSDLQVQVFDSAGTTVLPTATDVFSLNGTGTAKVFVTANEPGGGTKSFTFNLGALDKNKPANFTLEALKGESINLFTVIDTGGNITDFEHYRVDIAGTAATPLPAALPMFFGGLMGIYQLARRRQRKA
jgi:hypothetical protein